MMKNVMSVCLALLMISMGFAQKVVVPAAVKSAFQKLYPGISKVSWDNEKEGFEAEFKNDGQSMSVNFDKAGNLLETEKEIAANQLPMAVQEQLKGKKIKEAAEIVDAHGKKTYEAEVGGKDLIFNENGKQIK